MSSHITDQAQKYLSVTAGQVLKSLPTNIQAALDPDEAHSLIAAILVVIYRLKSNRPLATSRSPKAAASHNAYVKSRYQRLKAAGVCTLCAKLPPAPNRTLCPSCGQKNRDRARASYIPRPTLSSDSVESP